MTTYQYYCAEDDSEDHDHPFTPPEEYDGVIMTTEGDLLGYWFFDSTNEDNYFIDTEGN